MATPAPWIQQLYYARLKATSPTAKKALLAAEHCGRDWGVLESSDGSPRFVWMTCGRKFCPRCQGRYTSRLVAGMLEATRDIPPRELRHLIFTLPSVPLGELREGIERLYGCFRAWRDEGRRERHGAYWKGVRGYAWKLECCLSNSGDWNPHLHVLVHCPRGFDLWEGDPAQRAWERIATHATGRWCISPCIRRYEDGKSDPRKFVSYIFKHSVPYESDPTRLAEMAGAFHGVRFHGSGGSLKMRKVRAEPTGSKYHGTLRGALLRAKTSPSARDAHEAITTIRAFAQAKAKDPNAKAQAPPEVWDL